MFLPACEHDSFPPVQRLPARLWLSRTLDDAVASAVGMVPGRTLCHQIPNGNRQFLLAWHQILTP